jgi:hypothetical protein
MIIYHSQRGIIFSVVVVYSPTLGSREKGIFRDSIELDQLDPVAHACEEPNRMRFKP